MIEVENANTDNICIGVAYIRGIFVRGIYIKNTCAGITYFESVYIKSAYIGGIYIKDSIYSGAIDISSACIGIVSTYKSIRNLMFWDSYIYNFADNPYKFNALNLRLLVDSKLSMIISYYLYL